MENYMVVPTIRQICVEWTQLRSRSDTSTVRVELVWLIICFLEISPCHWANPFITRLDIYLIIFVFIFSVHRHWTTE